MASSSTGVPPISVFVSRPTWVADEFRPGLKAFMTRLEDSGLLPRTLGASDYPTKAPLDEVIELMERCSGAVVLGYPQISVATGSIRNKPAPSGLLLPTEWNHIEAGLAYARGLPLLVIHHVGVVRGIFDRGATNSFLYSLDLTDSQWPQGDALSGALDAWRDLVRDGKTSPKGSKASVPAVPKGSVPCPNCSTPGRPFYMTVLERDFQLATGSTHLCNRCHGTFNYQ